MCHLALRNYNKYMGFVDSVNKRASSAKVQLKRCQKRYHRQLACWVLGACLNNCKVAPKMLVTEQRYKAWQKQYAWIG